MTHKLQNFLLFLLIIQIYCSENVSFEKIRRTLRQKRQDICIGSPNRTVLVDNGLMKKLSVIDGNELKGHLDELGRYSKGLSNKEPVTTLYRIYNIIIPKLLNSFKTGLEAESQKIKNNNLEQWQDDKYMCNLYTKSIFLYSAMYFFIITEHMRIMEDQIILYYEAKNSKKATIISDAQILQAIIIYQSNVFNYVKEIGKILDFEPERLTACKKKSGPFDYAVLNSMVCVYQCDTIME